MQATSYTSFDKNDAGRKVVGPSPKRRGKQVGIVNNKKGVVLRRRPRDLALAEPYNRVYAHV